MNNSHTKARMTVAWFFGIYAAFIILFNMPFMQKALANWIANALEKQLNTEVSIGSVNIGLLNRVIINDINIEDQSNKEMLKVARASVSLSLIPLITEGRIDISSAQLFGTNAHLYRKSPTDEHNFQFVIDAFKSDNKESKPINLRINSLIMRNANISYDVLSKETKNTLDTNHLKIENAGFNLSLKRFSTDSLNVSIKRFQAKEINSGLDLKELAFKIEGNDNKAKITDFVFRLPKSSIKTDSINIYYSDFKKDQSFSFDETDIKASVSPSDFAFIANQTDKITDLFNLSITLHGSNNNLGIKRLSLTNESNSINLDASGKINNIQSHKPTFYFNIDDITIGEGEAERWTSMFMDNNESLSPLFKLGKVNYNGNLSSSEELLASEGNINTQAGSLSYTLSLNKDKLIEAEIESSDINLGLILDNDKLGKANISANTTLFIPKNGQIPNGNINAVIKDFDYNDYTFSDINLEMVNNSSDITLKAESEDDNLKFIIDGAISNINENHKNIIAKLNVKNLNPKAIHLTNKTANDIYSFNLNTDINYTDINHLEGSAIVNNLQLITDSVVHSVDNISVSAKLNGGLDQSIIINSDFADANIKGKFRLGNLLYSFQNIVSYHLPELVKKRTNIDDTNINYDITLYDSPIIHLFINENYTIDSPLNIYGSLNSEAKTMNLSCNAQKLSYNDNYFENINVNCTSTIGNMMISLTGDKTNDEGKMSSNIVAVAHNNKIDSDILIKNKSKDDLNLSLFATTFFSNVDGNLKTDINISNSSITINDSLWNISPAQLSYCNNQIECNNFKIAKGNQYLTINGKASPTPSDSIVATLNDIEIAYILDLVNFHSVNFGGIASGRAVINNLFGKIDANAHLYVKDFSLQDGIMGDANILAYWDKETDGISLNAHIVDSYMSQVGLTGTKIKKEGITDVNGYVSPVKSELALHIIANNTRADFLNGFLQGVLSDIDGCVKGDIDIVGSFGDINILGDATSDMCFVLNATKVPYCTSGDTIRLRYHEFNFEDITLHDKQNNVGVLNGKLKHYNLKDFSYIFDADITNLCAYNETEFNSDKFMAQVWANGDIHISGSDGHPLNISANVSPSRGSMFAYDSATPDALISNSFIDFNDITYASNQDRTKEFRINASNKEKKDSLEINHDKFDYHGDIYMNVNIDLNPNCEIKLRMDNTDDGYISTFGSGAIQARYYNKGAFQLFGNYNISRGNYRLYLQDLVYRNLNIQDGSKVEFNGNPFDANIHLICKHEINSVPLSDLTKTTAFSSNNKVKVDCYLDITGHINNMELSFNFELPNVSEETRQLVRSMVTSEEEMNKQMIYLLGFQRFYPNDLAQSNGEDYGTQAVNSLLSSTLSGQINQVLSNMIGRNSKWNFGTGIMTGENGWEDLDVEGILSGRLLNDRLLINGNFGYRDNSLTNQANFIGDFEVKYRIWENGDFYAKAYNQTNDRYFTKATLNTQGLGINFQHDFEKYTLFNIFKKKRTEATDSIKSTTIK